MWCHHGRARTSKSRVQRSFPARRRSGMRAAIWRSKPSSRALPPPTEAIRIRLPEWAAFALQREAQMQGVVGFEHRLLGHESFQRKIGPVAQGDEAESLFGRKRPGRTNPNGDGRLGVQGRSHDLRRLPYPPDSAAATTGAKPSAMMRTPWALGWMPSGWL